MNSKQEIHSANTLSVLKFSGDDASSFLQGQLTNDIDALPSGWQFSGYCNPKGRLIALFQIWKYGENFYATIDRSLVESTLKRLKMYVMRSKVNIEEITTAVCVGVIEAYTSYERFSISVEGTVHSLHFGKQALLVDMEGSIETNESCNWLQACISAGEPVINADNAELFVPQMVNLDLINGVNFKKGCYTGQEIVARMHYLGKLKQRMYVCQLKGDAHSGEKLLAADKNAGNIVIASDDLALAVVRRELLEEPIQTESGAQVTLLPKQPYPIPE